MKEFSFRAPMLLDASATVPVEDELHDAPGAASELAKMKRFALWLKSEIVNKGFAAGGPSIDEGGWIIVVPSNGGHVYIITGWHEDDEGLFDLIVMEMGGANDDVGDAVEDILRNATEITELKVE